MLLFGEQDFRQLKSAIRHFLLSGWGFPLPAKRSTQQDMENAEYALSQLPIEKLYDWETLIEQGFELTEKLEKHRSAPRSHVRKFVSWCIESGILIDPVHHEQTPRSAPAIPRGFGARPKMRRNPVDLSAYSLKEKQINPSLNERMQKFFNFLTTDHYEGEESILTLSV